MASRFARRGFALTLPAGPATLPPVSNALVLIVGALVFSGCSVSLSELRQTPPVRSGSVTAPEGHVRLASCVQSELNATDTANSLLYQTLDLGQGRSVVTGSHMGRHDPSLRPVIELSLHQDGGVVNLESRGAGGPGLWGWYGRRVEKKIWPIIEKCAGGKIKTNG